MKLNADATRATVRVERDCDADGLEDLISELMELRSAMTPPVPPTRPNPADNPGKFVGVEEHPAATVALLRDGGYRLWVRNSGIGWLGYTIEAQTAVGIARYILSSAEGKDSIPDLFTGDQTQRH